MFLLDTNICIYLMKNKYPSISERLFQCSPSEVAISTISLYELHYGAAKSNWGEKTKRQMDAFLSPFTLLPFDSEDAVMAGQVRGPLEQSGTPIGPYDIQIAAQALSRNCVLVTHNTKEFLRVPGLMLEDWAI